MEVESGGYLFFWGLTCKSGAWTLDLLLEVVWRNAGGGEGQGNEGQMLGGYGTWATVGDGEVGRAGTLKLDFDVFYSLLCFTRRIR